MVVATVRITGTKDAPSARWCLAKCFHMDCTYALRALVGIWGIRVP